MVSIFRQCRYPVILSIEDNCPVDGQRVIAQEITKILGEYLLRGKVLTNERAMPSPNQLRRKIIVKHKKLMFDKDVQGPGMSSDESALRDHMSETNTPPAAGDTDEMEVNAGVRKQGLMLMWNGKRWAQHIFILSSSSLKWTVEDVDDNVDTENVYHTLQNNRRNTQEDVSAICWWSLGKSIL